MQRVASRAPDLRQQDRNWRAAGGGGGGLGVPNLFWQGSFCQAGRGWGGGGRRRL